MDQRIRDVAAQLEQVVLGKREQIELCLTCLFAGGHLLIQDLPGIGKTTLARGLAHCLGLEFQRVQFTNDLLPGDILGVSVYEQQQAAFVFHSGAIFTQVLLADEINRATPKTQSALLEAMEEEQVTIEGASRPLPQPFFVIATQNPIEQAGTFPLPDSQLDRFLMRIELGYPGRDAERALLSHGDTKVVISGLKPLLSPADILELQQRVAQVHASEALVAYLLNILEFTRNGPHFQFGLSPRAGLGLLSAARSHAFLHGREMVLPEDVQAVAPWVLRHRLRRAGDLREPRRDELTSLIAGIPIP